MLASFLLLVWENILVKASSLKSASELGAFNQSARLAWGYSRPITGVTSRCSYASRTPVLFTHGFVEVACARAFPGRTGISVGESTSVAEGAMFVVELLAVALE
jgi:hypothetical protein